MSMFFTSMSVARVYSTQPIETISGSGVYQTGSYYYNKTSSSIYTYDGNKFNRVAIGHEFYGEASLLTNFEISIAPSGSTVMTLQLPTDGVYELSCNVVVLIPDGTYAGSVTHYHHVSGGYVGDNAGRFRSWTGDINHYLYTTGSIPVLQPMNADDYVQTNDGTLFISGRRGQKYVLLTKSGSWNFVVKEIIPNTFIASGSKISYKRLTDGMNIP